ncbi:MAG TPA: hypothetical protein VH020_07240 [Stellaceae bacterium]|nr:hypothetical protein [Stellaceae bacterium]
MTAATAWRVAVPVCGVALLALFAGLYLDRPSLYFGALRAWGEYPFRFPFLDTQAVFSALDCARQGLDTYRYNPCDVLTRAFVYSPLILEAAIFPVTSAWTGIAGFALALGFLAAIASLPPPRGWRDATIMALALLSTATLFAIERGNIDLLIFILIAIVGHLAMRGEGSRLTAYLAIVFAAGLKFYPLILLALTLREKPRLFIAINAAAAALLLWFVAHYHGVLLEAWQVLPTRPSDEALIGWGAVILPRSMTKLLAPVLMLNPWTAPLTRFLPDLLLLLLVATCFGRALAMARREENRARLAALAPAQALFLIVGSCLIVGCFFAGENIAYRGIFFLFLLPGLCAFVRADTAAQFGGTAVAIVLLMWGDFLVHGAGVATHALDSSPSVDPTVQAVIWLTLQLLWWRVVAGLAALIFCFVASTEIGALALARLARPRPVAR